MAIGCEQWTKSQRKAATCIDDLTSRKSGVRFAKANGMYDSTEWSANKRNQRLFVRSAIRDLLGASAVIRGLTLPGELWAFENDCVETFPESQFTGLESNVVTFERGMRWIPGLSRASTYRWHFPFGYADVCQRLSRQRKRPHCFMCIDMEALFSGIARPDRWKTPATFNHFTSGMNLIWLDSTSPVGSSSLSTAINNCWRFLRDDGNCVVGFSYTVGRDCREVQRMIDLAPGENAVDRRTSYIRFLLKASGLTVFKQYSHQYASANDEGTLTIGTSLYFVRRKLT